MTWAKVFVLDAIVDWGFNVVVSDVDVVWFKDPLPLFDIHQDAGKRIRAVRPRATPCGQSLAGVYSHTWPRILQC